MDMATMKTTRVIIGIPENKEREETRIAETRLIWIPGERPVIVPAVMLMIRARKISSIILLIALFYFGFLFPNFYVISGIIMMIAVLWIFYWADGFFNLNYRFRHYIVMIVLFTFGM